MKHNKFQKRICDRFIRQGAIVRPLVGSQYCTPGWPDRLVLWRQRVYFVEFKVGKDLVRPVQAEMIGKLQTAGFAAFILWTNEDTEYELQRVVAHTLGSRLDSGDGNGLVKEFDKDSLILPWAQEYFYGEWDFAQ